MVPCVTASDVTCNPQHTHIYDVIANIFVRIMFCVWLPRNGSRLAGYTSPMNVYRSVNLPSVWRATSNIYIYIMYIYVFATRATAHTPTISFARQCTYSMGMYSPPSYEGGWGVGEVKGRHISIPSARAINHVLKVSQLMATIGRP